MNEPKQSPQKAVSKQGTSAEPVLFGAHDAQKEGRNWTPLVIGFGLVLAVVALIALFGHRENVVPQSADPYAPMLVVEKARLRQADNFVGTTVTYIDLTVQNNGTRTVVGGGVQAVFRDTLGQVVQSESLPLRVLLPHTLGGEDEAGELALAPLGPGETRVLRLTLEHISSQWNQVQPELEFRGLRFK